MRYETARTGRPGHPASSTDTMARALGLFSIGLGLMQTMAPRALTRALGMQGQETLVLFYGLREIATGIGLLAAKDPAPWVWGRVAGDALDLATLAPHWNGDNHKRGNVGAALGLVAGVTALDLMCARQLSAQSKSPLAPARDYSDRSGFPKPPEEMRGAARDFEIPRDMRTPEALRPYASTEASPSISPEADAREADRLPQANVLDMGR